MGFKGLCCYMKLSVLQFSFRNHFFILWIVKYITEDCITYFTWNLEVVCVGVKPWERWNRRKSGSMVRCEYFIDSLACGFIFDQVIQMQYSEIKIHLSLFLPHFIWLDDDLVPRKRIYIGSWRGDKAAASSILRHVSWDFCGLLLLLIWVL